jgi:glycosyltransferase involved in cell wall biosynthesis
MRTCVIIPTYNESKAIAALLDQIKALALDTIVVDDGSKDNTAEIARERGVRVLSNRQNSGKGASLIKGYDFAFSNGFDAAISMDGDGQHSAGDIKSFIQKAESGDYGIVVGNRMGMTKGMPLVRILTNRFMSWLISLISRQRIPDTQCGFRLMKKEVFNRINLRTSKFETESEILIKTARAGFKIDSVPIKTIYSGQKSQINPLTDTLRFLRFIASVCSRKIKHV